MNNQSYGGIKWTHHQSVGDIERTTQLIVGARHLEVTEILESNGGDTHHDGNNEYLHDDAEADMDQMAAENLIFMARDGQMVSEIIAADDSVVVTDGNNAALELGQALVVSSDDFGDVYDDDTQQMVTEEVITDDWVEHQGEERVEISADQIIVSNSSQVLLDMVQDEYTASRPYPCDFCCRRFRKKASLNNHMIAHQNDRPQLCKLCGARFSRRAELMNHLKAHAEQQYADEAIQSEAPNSVVTFDTNRRQMDDHYYEQDWQMQTAKTIDSSNSQQEILENLTSGSPAGSSSTICSSASSVTTAVSTEPSSKSTSRGRISRLKLKEERQNIVEQKVGPVSSEINYLGCQELQAATASLKLTLEQSSAPYRANFPVLDESKPFVCQECGLAFAREKALLSHVKNHRVESPYECNQCNEMFWDSNSLQEHQKTHQFEESNSEFDPAEDDDDGTQSESESEQQLYGEFYCSQCGISFHRQDLLRRHTKQHLKQNSSGAEASRASAIIANDEKDAHHCCHTCGETFAEALDLLAHAEIHARFPPFKCVLCGEAFFEEQAIKRHLNTRHPHEMTTNSCILCGKECRDRKALIKHAWDHSREKCHSCSKCGKNFHNKARLKRHMASHRDKSVTCDVCLEEFPDGRSLSNHRHSHSTTSSGKLFPCNECGKTFGSRSSQQIHVRIHTGERPYGCGYCWKAFADGGTLRKHERIHTGEKPYACSVCPRAFNQRVVLREHIRSHHSGKDTIRGTYFCTVCSADLNTSNELIQHLIQHSDTNTAKQRQPVTGPRKYKRRRKLQPHEIAHLRAECKTENCGSDLEMSDFDMNNVDDLLVISDAESKSPPRKSKKPMKAASKRVANRNGKKNVSGGKMIKSELSQTCSESTPYGCVVVNNNNNNASAKQRHESTSSNSDKLWETKFLQRATNNQDEFDKSLFNNVEQGLQTIESLVVNNNETTRNGRNKRRTKQNDCVAQRTQDVQPRLQTTTGKATNTMSTMTTSTLTRGTRKKPATKAQAKTNTTRPRMIHTEKWRSEPGQDVKRTRSKTYITRTETTNLDLLQKKSVSVTTIVDDYEIISPATEPPNQISSSPLHIKQENEQQQNHLQHHQNQLQHIFDAHLLLESSSLRKEAYEKFNPSIVNDLEEILRSPLKSERNARLRFTSESSTTPQFLPEDDQHLIKIEPTSPDLREIVESQRSGGTSARTALRQNNTHNKYLLDTETNINGSRSRRNRSTTKTPSPSSSSMALSSSKKYKNNDLSNSASATKSANVTSSPSATTAANSSFLNYGVEAYNETVPNGNTSTDVSSTYFYISEVVSAADAAAASAEAAAAADAAAASANAAATKPVRRGRQFDCEMCSEVFCERTQLLEHAHIHF